MTLPLPTSPLLPIQTALHAVLTGDQELMELAPGGVWDYVPEGPDAGPPYPYIHLGEAVETPDNTHTGWGRQTVVTLHIWSQYRGHALGLRILARVMALLDHQPLTVAGHHHVATRYEFSQTLTDPEPPGDIRHVVARFRITTEQQP